MLSNYREVWIVDTEFRGSEGDRPEVVSLAAKELYSGRTISFFQEDLHRLEAPPFPIGPDVLIVGFALSAEWRCFLSLGWPLPMRSLDLFAENRVETNGRGIVDGYKLLGALAHRGLDHMDVAEKRTMRDLVLRGGPWTPEERRAITEYNFEDVEATERLLRAMLPSIDWPRAVHVRGDYVKSVAIMEDNGIPLDAEMHKKIRNRWLEVRGELIRRVDDSYGIFEKGVFKQSRFEAYLERHGIAWPRTPTGLLSADKDVFKRVALRYPMLEPLRDLLKTLGQVRGGGELEVGRDGRNRANLKPFWSTTGRNQPSSTGFIFGGPKWMRHLIKPGEGRGLAYIDFSQQEFGIAAAFSGDPAMIAAYASDDPYMTMAVQAGAAPEGATKETHPEARALYKTVTLAVQYGMGPESLAERIGKSVAEANHLLRQNRAKYTAYWNWSDELLDRAALGGFLRTPFGWTWHISRAPREAQVRNWPMQAAGADVMRLASIYMTRAGIKVCAPVHDAFLVEAPVEILDDVVQEARRLMGEASRRVTGGLGIKTEALLVRYPARFVDEHGTDLWRAVTDIVQAPTPGPSLPMNQKNTSFLVGEGGGGDGEDEGEGGEEV